jgi:hypothetical protein
MTDEEQKQQALELVTDAHFISLLVLKVIAKHQTDALSKFIGVLSVVGQLGHEMLAKQSDPKMKSYLGAQLASSLLTVGDGLMALGEGKEIFKEQEAKPEEIRKVEVLVGDHPPEQEQP